MTPTSRISTAATAKRCRSDSSDIFSRVRTPAGTSSHGSRSTYVILARNLNCAQKTNGRWRERNGRNISCARTVLSYHLRHQPPLQTLSYETTGDGLTFRTPPLTRSLEVTGPVAARLWISSETNDADLFLVLRVLDPADKEVTFIGSNDPRVPVGLGWLRASHRKLDPKLSQPYRPWHTHDEEWPLNPGEPVEIDVEIWPTSIVVPPGYTLALTVRGKDYEVDGKDAALPNAPYPMPGVGPFLHIDKDDRPPAIFDCRNTLHFAAGKQPYLLLPVIPGA